MMKRLLLVALAALCVTGSAHAAARTVYVVDQSTVVHVSDLENALPAFQAAVSNDFAPVWGQDAQLELTDAAPAGAWTIYVQDNSTMPGALGFHNFANGNVYARVFVRTTLNWNVAWQAVFTHELFEMLADPYIDRLTLGPRLYLVEVSDPVEEDAFNYSLPDAGGNPTPISDFVTPAWYSKRTRGPFDFARHVAKRGEVLFGGYVSWWQDGAWHQAFGSRRRLAW